MDDFLNHLDRKLDAKQRGVLLRLGELRATGQSSKHSGGFRVYEIADRPSITHEAIITSSDFLVDAGFITEKKISKYYSDGRREVVSLFDMTEIGYSSYFIIKQSQNLISEHDLKYLHSLIQRNAIGFKYFTSELMHSYLDFYSRISQEDELVSQKSSEYMSADEIYSSKNFAKSLRSAVDGMDRTGKSNSEIQQLYYLIDELDRENNREKPRKSYIILVLTFIRDLLMLTATLAGAVFAYLQYIK